MCEFYKEARNAISKLIQQKNSPCLATISNEESHFVINIYENFGGFHQRGDLRQDLLNYVSEYVNSESPVYTFWAIFRMQEKMDEELFERRLWDELSSLTSEKTWEKDRDPRFSANPEDKEFCFSLGGKALLVVGLHPNSSRQSRRFPWPTLMFNVYEQAELLAEQRGQKIKTILT